MSIFSNIFGGKKAETVEESFNKLSDEQKTQIVEVAKNYSTPAPIPPVAEATPPTGVANGNGKEEPTADNGATATTPAADNNQGTQAQTEETTMGTEPIAPVATPPAAPTAPAPLPETALTVPAPTVEYLTKETGTAFERALEESNKLIAEQAKVIADQAEAMKALRKDLDDTKSQYARFVNPAKEFDVTPAMGVEHVSGQRQSYKDIAAKTFNKGR